MLFICNVSINPSQHISGSQTYIIGVNLIILLNIFIFMGGKMQLFFSIYFLLHRKENLGVNYLQRKFAKLKQIFILAQTDERFIMIYD